MRLSITPTAVADYFEGRLRHARIARQNAKLRRELSRLPSYVADNIQCLRIAQVIDLI